MKTYNLEAFDPQPLDISPPVVAHFIRGWSTRLVVSFSGVGTDRNVVPPLEFFDIASRSSENHVIFVSDPSRSWMNGPGVADSIRDQIVAYCKAHGVTEIVALGNSMGGFSALVLADLVPVKTVIAFSPQFSAHPDLVPEETRWWYFRRSITEWPFPDVGPLAQSATKYFCFHSDAADEVPHWARFPFPDGFNHFILSGTDHNLVRILKKRGLLAQVVNAAIDGRSRSVRLNLERTFLGRHLNVYRREVFQENFPDVVRPYQTAGAPAPQLTEERP